MLEDMAMRGLRSHTQHDYIRFVRSFAGFLGHGRPIPRRLRRIAGFKCTNARSGVQPPTINGSVSALRFLFSVTLDRPDLSRRLVLARYPRKLPAVLSKLRKLAGCSKRHLGRNTGLFSALAYGAGLRVSEVASSSRFWRHRQHAHADQGRTGQGTQGPQCHCCRRSAAGTAAALVARGKRRGVMLPQGWLFPGRNSLEPISTRQINRAVHDGSRSRWHQVAVSARNTLRHSFANDLLEQDVDIRTPRCCWGTASLIRPRSMRVLRPRRSAR